MEVMSAWAIPGIKECYRYGIVPDNVKADRIVEKVCEYFDVPPERIKNRWRKRKMVTVRKWCMYFIKRNTTMSLKDIGLMFSGRDHTTAIHNIRFVKDQLKSPFDNDFKEDYQILIKLI